MGLKWNIDQIYCNNKSQRPSGHPCNSYNHDWDDADDDDNLVFHFSKVRQTNFFTHPNALVLQQSLLVATTV